MRKTPAQFQQKLQRDLAILREETRDHPDNARWWFYLGQTLEGLAQSSPHAPREEMPAAQTDVHLVAPARDGESTRSAADHHAERDGYFEQAAEAYERCARLRGWDEEGAWGAYKAASCLCELKRFREATELCALGLTRHSGFPELAWLAGYCCYQLGRLRDAVNWSHLAISLGHVEGRSVGADRISFRHLPGWYEAPYDVLRYAYQKLGQPVVTAEFERKFEEAKRKRSQLA